MKLSALTALVAVAFVVGAAAGCGDSGGAASGGTSDDQQLKEFREGKPDYSKMTAAEKAQWKKQPDGSWTFKGFPVPAASVPANFNPNASGN